MKTFTFLSGAAMLGLAGMAVAQGGPEPRPDRDADVTRQQVVERSDARFTRLDANRDGRFTPEEAGAMREQRRGQRAERMFERLDLDRNGSITREEMSQAQAGRGERGENHTGRGGRRGGPGMGGMRGHRGPNAGMRGQRLFGEQGFVTAEQMRQRALERFDRADANRDGTLTAAERREARQGRRERHEERRPG
jgi:hypothetical protein